MGGFTLPKFIYIFLNSQKLEKKTRVRGNISVILFYSCVRIKDILKKTTHPVYSHRDFDDTENFLSESMHPCLSKSCLM